MRNLQFSGMYGLKYITLQQVSKPTAKKLFKQGIDIYCQSSNFAPFGVWSVAQLIEQDKDFGTFSNDFAYYNCGREQGKYITYYKVI